MTADPADTGKPDWGLLPEEIVALLRRREWHNPRALKSRLKGEKPFPIEIGLKPPRGQGVLAHINHLQRFVSAWRRVPWPQTGAITVHWEKRGFRHISAQEVPVKLIIDDITALTRILGETATEQLKAWRRKIDFIMSSPAAPQAVQNALQPVLIDHLETLDHYRQQDLELLVSLLPQLSKNLGNNHYLRALPVVNVDTKFIETHYRLIEALVDVIHDGTVKPVGLLAWLGCQEKPRDWLLIRPLCPATQAALGGLPLLRLATATLLDYPLPAARILVVENEQSCLALPPIADTISVSGGGKNIAWMSAPWLTAKAVAYWGDIDSAGLSILSEVRSKLSSVVPLMMNRATVIAFKDRMVPEPDSPTGEPPALTPEELHLFRQLRAGEFGHARLEQERIPGDYVQGAVDGWLGH